MSIGIKTDPTKALLMHSGPITQRFVVSRTSRTGLMNGLATGAVALLASTAQAAGGGDDHDATTEAIFQGINLLLLLGILFYFARKPIAEYFSGRHHGIKSELASASDLLAKAEQRNSELQRRLVDLSSEVEEIKETAARRAEEEAERILAEARAAADRIRTDATATVAQELTRAKASLQGEAANLALDLAAQKLTAQVGDADRDRLVDEFIMRVEPSEGVNQ